ncbi:hypothetical protein Tdes44962_MAKER08623 [Teratosphaeria destructans]|uniref:Uncharacterized protein n=1 Tax=Teratosphaeria destructans TaxID=418781 RepID=A0A9W7W4E2_9PEZI|nr:hypothetical protein Tdes44962_MAKER08623 [Teratosphaeria destructans]
MGENAAAAMLFDPKLGHVPSASHDQDQAGYPHSQETVGETSALEEPLVHKAYRRREHEAASDAVDQALAHEDLDRLF